MELQVAGDLIRRSDTHGEVGVLGLVLVVAFAVLQDGNGVGQRLAGVVEGAVGIDLGAQCIRAIGIVRRAVEHVVVFAE